MDGHGYGSVVCNRPFRARSVSFIWQEDHESTENLLAVSESRRVLREKLGEPIFAGYVTNVKSRFFSLGLVLGASLQMFMVSIVLMVVSFVFCILIRYMCNAVRCTPNRWPAIRTTRDRSWS